MNGFLSEIGEQPAVLRATCDALPAQMGGVRELSDQLRSGPIRRVILSGMGASFFATHPAQQMLIRLGLVAHCVEASDLLHYQQGLFDARTMLVLVSQSGHSVEIVKLLDLLAKRVPILGISNSDDSPLAQRSTVHVRIHAGAEATVSSKTYTCTLAALHAVARVLAGSTPDIAALTAAADAIEAGLPVWNSAAGAMVEQMNDAQSILVLGRGASLASALTGALVVKESAKFPAEGMNAAQVRHGPIEMVDERIGAVLFAGSDPQRALTLALANDLRGYGARVALVDHEPAPDGMLSVPLPAGLDPFVQPIAEIVPMQLFGAHLAAKRGFTPGVFRYSKKVTMAE
ncbi:MAG: SIS domain-containing protein [Chloroflexi bacterium]|nr:SIS domain-containing protein [Chloroflexota bacterium]